MIHKATQQCLERPLERTSGSAPVGQLKLKTCVDQWFDAQLWVASWSTAFQNQKSSYGFLMTDESVCVDNLDGEARAMACSGLHRQLWYHDMKSDTIVHVDTAMCLSLARPSQASLQVAVYTCDGSSDQQWLLQSVPWH